MAQSQNAHQEKDKSDDPERILEPATSDESQTAIYLGNAEIVGVNYGGIFIEEGHVSQAYGGLTSLSVVDQWGGLDMLVLGVRAVSVYSTKYIPLTYIL